MLRITKAINNKRINFEVHTKETLHVSIVSFH